MTYIGDLGHGNRYAKPVQDKSYSHAKFEAPQENSLREKCKVILFSLSYSKQNTHINPSKKKLELGCGLGQGLSLLS